jgi:hypothetical protein
MADLSTDDKMAVIEVLLRYATAIDQRHWDLFTTCFTKDADLDYGEVGRWHDASTFTAFMSAGISKLGQTMHRMSNFVVAGEGDRAWARSYVDAVRLPAKPGGVILQNLAWYDDRLVRQAEGWKISQRRLTPVWKTTFPA